MFPLSLKNGTFTYNLNEEYVTVDIIKATIDDTITVVFRPYIVMASNNKTNLVRTYKYNQSKEVETWVDSEGKIIPNEDINKKLRDRLFIEIMLD